MRSWRRIVLGGEHGGLEVFAQFALGLGDAALGVLIGLAPVAALDDPADGVLRLLLEFGQRLVGAALQFLDLGGFALLPLAGDFLLAAVEFDDLLAQADFERLRLFDAVVQLAEEARDVAFAVAHGETGAAHDVLGHAEAGGDFEAGRFSGQAQLQVVGRLEGLLVESPWSR